ncbi:MAG: hypothetical protein JW829_19950 [Pirellulales bacterium]|nr:hypothetical protein [Pirellulales bacterium]
MRCEELEVRIHELLDQRKSIRDDPEVVAHAAVCAECDKRVASFQAMLDGVQALSVPELSPQFDRAVLRRLANPTAVPRRRTYSWYSVAASFAVAASLLVAGLVWWHAQRPQQDGGSQLANPSKQSADLAAFVWTIPGRVPSERIHEVCWTTGRNVVTLPGKFRRVAMSPDDTSIAGRIRPVTRPMGVAWAVLKRALPANTEKTPDSNHDTGWIHSPGRIAVANASESSVSYPRSA